MKFSIGSQEISINHHGVRFGSRFIAMPHTKGKRILLGIAFCLGGLLWFLPILGAWMLPVGIWILSIDVGFIRRARRRMVIWWYRRKPRRPGVVPG